MAFNDGIFAIAITLLILDIRLPDIPGQEIDTHFLAGLISISPQILGFVLSFFIIAMYWLSYHRFFLYIRRTDRVLVLQNILFLFFIVFMPFPTYLLGLYGSHQPIVIFYAAVVVVTSTLLAMMWRHATIDRLLVDPDLDGRIVRFFWIRSLIPVFVFLLSIGVAFVSPLLAMIIWGLNFFVVFGIYARFYPELPAKEG